MLSQRICCFRFIYRTPGSHLAWAACVIYFVLRSEVPAACFIMKLTGVDFTLISPHDREAAISINALEEGKVSLTLMLLVANLANTK